MTVSIREAPAGDLVEGIARASRGSSAPRSARGGSPAAGANSIVSVSPLISTGRASTRSVEIGIERSRTASTTSRCQASRSWSSSSGGRRRRAAPVPRRRAVAAAAARRRRRSRGGGRRRRPALRRGSRVATAGAAPMPVRPRLEQLEPMRERLARQVGLWARHLDERELERQARVATLAHVVDGEREEVDQAEHRRLGQLVRLLAEALARLLGDGQRLRHVADVLHEQELAEMLDQVDDEPADVLSLLGELLDLDEGAGGVAVDDRVAEPEERVLLDPADELEHVLHGDRAAGRGGELVERRDRVAERAVRAARDQRERRVRARRSPRPRRRGGGRRRAPAAAAAGRRTSGSASGRWGARLRDRSCRRRRRGGAAAPRSASAARSTPAS